MKAAERAAGGRGASGEEQDGGAPGAGLGAGEGRRPRRARPGQGVAGAGAGGGEGGVRRRTKVAARATADFGALRSNVRVFRQDECVLRSTFVYEDGPGRWQGSVSPGN